MSELNLTGDLLCFSCLPVQRNDGKALSFGWFLDNANIVNQRRQCGFAGRFAFPLMFPALRTESDEMRGLWLHTEEERRRSTVWSMMMTEEHPSFRGSSWLKMFWLEERSKLPGDYSCHGCWTSLAVEQTVSCWCEVSHLRLLSERIIVLVRHGVLGRNSEAEVIQIVKGQT